MRVPLEVEKEIERQKIAAYVVGHLPIVKAYAIKIGLVDIINGLIARKMGVEPRLFFPFFRHAGAGENLDGSGYRDLFLVPPHRP